MKTLIIAPNKRYNSRSTVELIGNFDYVDFLPLLSDNVKVSLTSDRLSVETDISVIKNVFDYDLYFYTPYNYSMEFCLLRNLEINSDFRFLFSQWQSITVAIEEHLNKSNVVNKPSSGRLMACKAVAYQKLLQNHFNVPKTLFSNDSATIASCFSSISFIEKVSGFHNSYSDTVFLPASSRTEEEILQNEFSVSASPSCFQTHFKHSTELRFFVVGSECTTIEQKRNMFNCVDLRFEEMNSVEYRISNKHKKFVEKLVQFTSDCGLRYCAYDVLHNEASSDYAVVDCNPHGEWDWIPCEEAVDQISKSFSRICE